MTHLSGEEITRIADHKSLEVAKDGFAILALLPVEGARKTLVESSLRLVVAIANRYNAPGLRLLDLIQEGNLGLLQAVEHYDWRSGSSFSICSGERPNLRLIAGSS